MAPLDVTLGSSAPLRLCLGLGLSLSGLLTTPTPGSPAFSGLLTAPLLLLPLFLLPPPSSLLRLSASWPGARPATAAAAAYSCCRCCCSLLRLLRLLLLRPQTGCFNPAPAGTQPALPRKEGRGGRRKIGGACGRPGIPLLVGCCCHWSAGSPKRVAGNVPDAS